jgi:hypothetical protein
VEYERQQRQDQIQDVVVEYEEPDIDEELSTITPAIEAWKAVG